MNRKIIDNASIMSTTSRNPPTSADTQVVNPFLDKIKEKSLEDQANCLSRWTLSYLDQLMKLGTQKVLESEDCGVASNMDKAEYAYDKVQMAWENEKKAVEITNKTRKNKAKKEPNLTMVLLRSFGIGKFTYAMVVYVISVVIQFGPVLLLNQLVIYFQSGKVGFINPWVAVVLMGVFPVVVSVLQTQHFIILNHMAVFVRTGCCTLLYSKSMKVSSTGRSRTNTGQVMNMMSTDTAQLQRFLQIMGDFLVSPLQIVIALVLIYTQVQNATWVGVGYLVALAPVNVAMFGIISKMRTKALKFSDARVKIINEVLSGIRIIKFYAWEKAFRNEVDRIREHELKALTTLIVDGSVVAILLRQGLLQISNFPNE